MIDILNKLKIQSFLALYIIDECLTWSEHITQVVKKCQGLPVSLLKLDTFESKCYEANLLCIYYPYLIYGNLIWGNTYKSAVQKLLNVQKKIIRSLD